MAFSYSAINSFINNYAAELSLGMCGPLVFLVYAATLFMTRPVAGKLMDRYGHGVVLYASTISMAVGLVLAAFVLDAAGYRAMYLLCACIAFAAFLYCLFVACPPKAVQAEGR